MDETLFYVGTLIPLGATLLTLSLRHKEKDFAPAFSFIGGVIGILFASAANSDGSITVAYNASQTIGLWPALYLPILFSVLAFFAAIYAVASSQRF